MLCAKYKKAKAERFYDNKLLAVVENESVLLLYDFPMLCDSETEERRPGIQRKKRKWGWEKKKHCNFNHETSHVREAANSLKLFLADSLDHGFAEVLPHLPHWQTQTIHWSIRRLMQNQRRPQMGHFVGKSIDKTNMMGSASDLTLQNATRTQ